MRSVGNGRDRSLRLRLVTEVFDLVAVGVREIDGAFAAPAFDFDVALVEILLHPLERGARDFEADMVQPVTCEYKST